MGMHGAGIYLRMMLDGCMGQIPKNDAGWCVWAHKADAECMGCMGCRCYHLYTPYNEEFPGTVLSTGMEDFFDSVCMPHTL